MSSFSKDHHLRFVQIHNQPESWKLFLDCLSGFADLMAWRILGQYHLRIIKGISLRGLVVTEFHAFHFFEHTQLLPISGGVCVCVCVCE